MRFNKWIWTLPLLLLTIVISPVAESLAQANCPDLVQRALLALGDNCADMDRNSACYGYNLVNAEFTEVVSEDFFTAPADRAELALISSLSTSPMQVENDLWGVAVLNLQANIPNTIPGQAVKFILLGDTEIENAVAEDAFEPVDPVDVSAIARLNVRSAPTLNANVVHIVNEGATLPADGKSADDAWVRVVVDGLIGWVARDYITASADVDTLPVITNETRMPMQAFYLRTGVQQPACEEAPPNSLLIQGPDNFVVNLTINGAEVQLASTMIARTVVRPDGSDGLEIVSVSGSVKVEGETLTAGETTWMPLAEAENLGTDGEANDKLIESAPVEPSDLSPEVENAFCLLNEIDATSVLNYTVPISCDAGIFPREDETPEAVNPPVQTSEPNDDDEPDDDNEPNDDDEPNTEIDCAGFCPTSPLGQVGEDTATFYWDGVAAPDGVPVSYRLNIYNADGSLRSAPPSQGLNAQISGLRLLDTISWSVDALVAGQVVCSTARIGADVVGRPTPATEAPPPVVIPPFAANWYCLSDNIVKIEYNNLPAGETLTVYFEDVDGGVFGGNYTNPSDHLMYTTPYEVDDALLSLSPSGATQVLIGGLNCHPLLTITSGTCLGVGGQLAVIYIGADPGEVVTLSATDGFNTYTATSTADGLGNGTGTIVVVWGTMTSLKAEGINSGQIANLPVSLTCP